MAMYSRGSGAKRSRPQRTVLRDPGRSGNHGAPEPAERAAGVWWLPTIIPAGQRGRERRQAVAPRRIMRGAVSPAWTPPR
jgi:hypothetical protein